MYVRNDNLKDYNKHDVLALDFETESLESREIELFSLAAKDGDKIMAGSFTADDLEELEVLIKGKTLVFHNFKFDGRVMADVGFNIHSFKMHDTMLMAINVDNGEKSYSLKALAPKYAGMDLGTWEGSRGAGVDEYMKYSAEDAAATLRLYYYYRTEILTRGTKEAYIIERDALYPLIAMEMNGMIIDTVKLAELKKLTEDEQTGLADKLYADFGRVFKIDYFTDLAEYLFDHLGLPYKKKYNTPKGGRGTGKNVLQDLERSIPNSDPNKEKLMWIVRYKKLSKLTGTFFPSFKEAVTSTGRAYPNINVIGASTGRYACPLFHQMPSAPIVEGDTNTHIRSVIVPEEGWKIMSADYSQIELRVMAHFSEDANMIKGYSSGGDYHQFTADTVSAMGFPLDRRQAKIVNFSILFGAGPGLIAQQLGCPMKEASKVLDNYYSAFSGIVALREKVVRDFEEQGYIETLGGKMFLRPEGFRSDWGTEGILMSYLIQGGAAVIMKKGMGECYKALKENFNKVKMLLTIHDELVFEVRDDFIEEAEMTVRKEMEGCMKIKVPLKVEIHTGNNFAECK